VGVKLPRVDCQDCGRPIAAGPVAGRLTKGRLARHDPPERRSLYGTSLVSCPGSLAIVDLPLPARQMELTEAIESDPDGMDTVPLF
jgi:hypothetical protein